MQMNTKRAMIFAIKLNEIEKTFGNLPFDLPRRLRAIQELLEYSGLSFDEYQSAVNEVHRGSQWET